MEAPLRFFDSVDLTASSEDVVWQLRQADDFFDYYMRYESEDENVWVQPADKMVMRSCSSHPDPEVRRTAVDILVHGRGGADWDALEQWLMDPDENVRREAIQGLGNGWLIYGYVQETDKERLVGLLERSIAIHADLFSTMFFRELAGYYSGYLELTWVAANRLLSVEKDDLWSNLVLGYFEHILTENNWGPEDTHIAPWLNDPDRVAVILEVADWMGPEEGRLTEMLEVLTKSKDSQVSKDARLLLSNGRFALRQSDDQLIS